jgi:hypothetical protein
MGQHNTDSEETQFTGAIERLTDEVNTLRIAVDELREELVWELRQLREGTPEWKARFRLTSMPADPTAPDFAERVNAVDASVLVPPQDLAGLVLRMTQAAATSRLAVVDWYEDYEFPLGEVFAIEAPILDWFAEYVVVVHREGDWFLCDDGEGSHYLLWTRGDECFVRRLTVEEEQSVTRVSGLEPDSEYQVEASPVYQAPAAAARTVAPSTQRSLWQTLD